jgi:hypothetical protein
MRLLYKISWAMNSCFFSIALWISVIYWTVLHKCKSWRLATKVSATRDKMWKVGELLWLSGKVVKMRK